MKSIVNIVNSIDQHLGRRLRLLRQSRRMSVQRLAQIVGASPLEIEKYEAGSERVSAVGLLRIAHALNQSVAYFFEDARAAAGVDGQSFAPEGLHSEDAVELLRAFANVRDPSARRTIIDLAISLASPEKPDSGANIS